MPININGNGSNVTTTEKAYWNAKEDTANKGVASGYASLDTNGCVPSSQLDLSDFGGGDMNASVYDSNGDGTVDSADTAAALTTARTITIGNTGKTFDGSGDISFSLIEIGAGDGTGDMVKATYDTNQNGVVDNAEKVNGHTVESDVPASAAFTDTTYNAATQSSDGLLSAADKTKLDAITGTGTMTAAEILTELITVDGSGSELDADKLDGMDSTEFAPTNHGTHVTFGTGITALESGVAGITGIAETVSRSDHTHTLPAYPDLAAHAGNAGIHTTAEKQAAWDRLKNLLRPPYMEGGGGIYLMFDGVDFSNGAQLSFVVPSNTYGDPLMINNSISMLVTTKFLYKQNTTEYPMLIRGEAVTVWYDLSNDCFYLKAGSTAGDTTDLSLKIGKLEGQQLIDRREILDIKIKLDELNVAEFLNKTGIGFFDLFEDNSNIDTTNTTATVADTDVSFSSEQLLKFNDETFESFSDLELAVYDLEREVFEVDVDVSASETISMNITPGSRVVGEKFWYNGEIYTITGVTES